MFSNNDNTLIMAVNGAGVLAAYVMLGLSLWLSTEVPLATKGYWAIAVLMLTLALVNFVKYRFEDRLSSDRLKKLEDARTERLLAEYAGDRS